MSTLKTDLRVRDVMMGLDAIPVVREKTLFKEVMEAMSKHRLGIACIVDGDGRLVGVFTDGDLRRILLRDQKPFAALFVDDAVRHAHTNPTTVDENMNLADAIEVMEDKQVWDLPVVDGDRRLLGLLHLHPAIKAVLGM
ncbi:MAG: CBS domain-containing protein [Alphaproteobacteria bacterium]|nr:CBS domain-containing protein [Alphaproteobacteria bacterium]